MAKPTKKSSESTSKTTNSVSRQALADFISDISSKSVSPNESLLHCAVAINQILINPETSLLLDEDLKSQLKDVWLKLKNTGIDLIDPPGLFGLPEGFDSDGLAN